MTNRADPGCLPTPRALRSRSLASKSPNLDPPRFVCGPCPSEAGLMYRRGMGGLMAAPILLAAVGVLGSWSAREGPAPPASPKVTQAGGEVGRFVDLFCVECHNREDRAAGLALDTL